MLFELYSLKGDKSDTFFIVFPVVYFYHLSSLYIDKYKMFLKLTTQCFVQVYSA